MQYDSICLSEKCRANKKQLFCSLTLEDQIHFDEKHAVELIHPGSIFFRSLKSEPIGMSSSLERQRAQLHEQYQKSVEHMKSILKAKFKQYDRNIGKIYELNGQAISLELLQPHLKKVTSKTQFYLDIINWKKANPSEDPKDYIEKMPADYIKSYKKAMASLVDIFDNGQLPSFNKSHEQSEQPQVKDPQPDLQLGSLLMHQLNKPVQALNIQNQNLQPKSFLEKQLTNKHQIKDKEVLKQLALLFCTSDSQLKYKFIKQPLLAKLPTAKKFRSYLDSLMHKIYLNIEQQLTKTSLKFIKTRVCDRDRIITDLKNYRAWMDPGEADIYIRVFRSFINPNAEKIKDYEIYVIYQLLISKIIEKMGIDNFDWVYNCWPINLEKEFLYLYIHYDSFSKVKEILVNRYRDKKLPQCLMQTLKDILVKTYRQLQKRQLISNQKFYNAILEEEEFSGELWSLVMSKCVEYQIKGTENNFEKTPFEEMMADVVRKIQTKLKYKINPSGNSRTIEPVSNNLKNQTDEKKNPFGSLDTNKGKGKSRVITVSQQVKIECISDSSSSSYYELDSSQKND